MVFRIKAVMMIIVVALAVAAPAFSAVTADSAQSDPVPWSGYWWPTTNGGLATGIDYRRHPAPLEKYDGYVEGVYPGLSSAWYLERYYDPDAPQWYGLCQAYASAAVYERFDFHPSVHDNLLFRVGDKKGLITACHTIDPAIRVNAHDPAVFHLWLLQYIKDQKMAFYAELDPGEEVWNYPVYRYEMTLNRSDGIIAVTCRIGYADDQVDPDFQGTRERTAAYTYRLVMDGDAVVSGEWTGNSVIDHPQQLALPTGQAGDNPYLDCGLIRSIAQSRDDELESADDRELAPGRYSLILADDDDYVVSADPGDHLFLNLSPADSLMEPIRARVTDGSGTVIATLDLVNPVAFDWSADNPPYRISLRRQAYDAPGFYELVFDLKKSFEFADMKLQKGLGWGGFAVMNPRDEPCDRIYVAGFTVEGIPMETYAGPLVLGPREKRTILYSELIPRITEQSDLYGVKILAPGPLQVTDLVGRFGRAMAVFDAAAGAPDGVIADFTDGKTGRTVSWGLYNPEAVTGSLALTHFGPDGQRAAEASLTLTGRSVVHYKNGSGPFASVKEGGWARVSGAPAEGYVQWTEGGLSRLESLPLLVPGKALWIPHLAEGGPWEFSLTLINVAEAENTARLRLLNGGAHEESFLILNPGEKRVVRPADLFSAAVMNDCALSITGEGMLAGFYTFKTPADDAKFPLLSESDLRQSLRVPHAASGNGWWTALNLFNPGEEGVTCDFLPFDAGGNLLTDLVAGRSLAPLTKDVLTLEDVFGPGAGRVASVEIRASEGGRLMGVLCYGNTNLTMLAGKVMK